MTDETLSALLDGECSPEELNRLLDTLDRNPHLKRRYSRLWLARESQLGSHLRAAHLDFPDGVMAALDREMPSSVVPFRQRTAWGWRPLAGLAAAAALAGVAVLVLVPERPGPAAPQVAQSKPVRVAPPAEVEAAAAHDRGWLQLDADSSRRLDSYWILYSQSRAQQGMGGTLGYARYAAYTSESQAPASDR